MSMNAEVDEAECAELRAQDRHERKHAAALRRNPSCADPDHPGCEQCDGSLEEREEALRTEFLHAALRDVKAPATFTKKFTDYSAGVDKKFQRHSTVGEAMFEALDYRNGPEVDDLLKLLSRAANGEDIRPQALELLHRMASKFAEMNVVVVL